VLHGWHQEKHRFPDTSGGARPVRGRPPLFVQPPGTVQPLKQSRECGCLSKHLANRRRVWVKKQGHDSLSKPTEGLISLVKGIIKIAAATAYPAKAKSLSGSFTTQACLSGSLTPVGKLFPELRAMCSLG
jgi:hypothetical protein